LRPVFGTPSGQARGPRFELQLSQYVERDMKRGRGRGQDDVDSILREGRALAFPAVDAGAERNPHQADRGGSGGALSLSGVTESERSSVGEFRHRQRESRQFLKLASSLKCCRAVFATLKPASKPLTRTFSGFLV